MKNTSIHPNKVLILEDQRIVGFDLERQLKRNGYCVSFEKTYEAIQKNFLSGLSEIIISSIHSLKNSFVSNADCNTDIFHQLKHVNTVTSGTNTIIIDNRAGKISHFEKPYKTEDIISFVASLIQANNLNRK